MTTNNQGSMDEEDYLERWFPIVRGGFLEMPGLQLTPDEARRLWQLNDWVCTAVLTALLDEGFLRVTAAGRYAWSGTTEGGPEVTIESPRPDLRRTIHLKFGQA